MPRGAAARGCRRRWTPPRGGRSPGRGSGPGGGRAAEGVQWLLMALAVAGAVCLIALAAGQLELTVVAAGGDDRGRRVGGPLVSAGCRFAARGPARRYGQAAERRLRDAAADCGRARVLEPVAAELMRYREVREQFAVVAGTSPRAPHARDSRSESVQSTRQGDRVIHRSEVIHRFRMVSP